MRNRFFILLFLFFIPYLIYAQKIGVGIIIGEPTGLNFITHLETRKYLNIAAGWSPDAFNSHFDLNIKYDLKEKGLYWYWGAGALFKLVEVESQHKGKESEQEFNIGLRIPFGIEYILQDIKLAFFGEIVPGLKLIPASDAMFNGAIGIRYYFK